MKPLTDEQRKRLALYLGEKCGHEERSWYSFPCPKCDTRSFTTYEDLGKLKDKLVENGEWVPFEEWAENIYFCNRYDSEEFCMMYKSFVEWLFRHESCGLVAEWLEQKEGK
jgi:hypothetical protein